MANTINHQGFTKIKSHYDEKNIKYFTDYGC